MVIRAVDRSTFAHCPRASLACGVRQVESDVRTEDEIDSDDSILSCLTVSVLAWLAEGHHRRAVK